jgi:multiple sugar transport system permease protein
VEHPGIVAEHSEKETQEIRGIIRRRKWLPYLILSPALILTIGILYPFFVAVYYTLTDFTFNNPVMRFVGLANYGKIFQSPEFWNSFAKTIEYAFICTVVEVLLGTLIAFLLNQENALCKVLRILLMFPLMIAPILSTILWHLMTNLSVGILSHYLFAMGITGFKWEASPHTAMFTVILVDVWVYTPFIILLVLAGLRSLPQAPFESALLDGGSAWFTFRNLTLPLLAPVIIIALIFRLLIALQEFSVIYGMTAGGPGSTTMTLSLLAYDHGFLFMNISEALTYMVVLWVIILILSQTLVNYWANAQKRASGVLD